MSYVNTKTKQIVEVADIIAENPNVSFPSGTWSDDILTDLGYAELNYPETLAPGPYEYLEESVPVEKDGKWYRSFIKKDINEEERVNVLASQWHTVRGQRNTRLSESDWTQLPDAQVDKEEWAAYRQTLRDITNTSTDPFNITWPAPPASKGP